MRELLERLNFEVEAPRQEVSAVDLLGAVGLVNPCHRPGTQRVEALDFQQVRLALEVALRQWRVQQGVAVEDARLKSMKPGPGICCPLCLHDVGPQNAECLNCGLRQQSFWDDHCPGCMAMAGPGDLHCSLCGTALVGTADAEREEQSRKSPAQKGGTH